MGNISSLWAQVPPSTQVLLRDLFCAITLYILGKLIGGSIKTLTSAKGLDKLLRFPWVERHSAAQQDAAGQLKPTDLIGGLCSATIWAGAAFSLLKMHGMHGHAADVQSLVRQVWLIAAVGGISMVLAGWLGRSVCEVIDHPAVAERLDQMFTSSEPNASRPFSKTVSRTACVALYAIVLLPTVILASELLRMRATTAAISATWDLTLRAGAALGVLGIGWLGVKWTRLEAADTDGPRERIRVALAACATALSAAVVLGGSGSLLGLFIVAGVFYMLYPVRDYVRDLWAGFYLKTRGLKKVQLEAGEAKIVEIGLLETRLKQGKDERFHLRNQVLMAAVVEPAT